MQVHNFVGLERIGREDSQLIKWVIFLGRFILWTCGLISGGGYLFSNAYIFLYSIVFLVYNSSKVFDITYLVLG
jgi:hypothetical protein